MQGVRGGPSIVVALVVLVLTLIGASAAAADLTFGVMNAPEGVYWRSEPNWAAAERVSGFGVYNGTIIAVHCYQSGTAVEGSADTMWEQATDVAGPGYGSGWVNEHFINDGQPINQPSPGVPPCNAPPPPPPPPPPPGLVFTVFNAEGGIYYRSSPHWADTPAIPGVGVYNGDQVQLICGAFGDPVGPYNDTAWSYVNNLSRSVGDGWVNEHFINDGMLTNQFVPGEPMCGPEIPGVSSGGGGSSGSSGGGGGGSSPPPSLPTGGSLYFSPYPSSFHGSINLAGGGTAYAPSPATFTMNYDQWHPTPDNVCPKLSSVVPGINGTYGTQIITTLAAWSKARTAPFLFLAKNPAWAPNIHYILLFDPGDKKEYAEGACKTKYDSPSLLAKWLASNGANRLVVLAGQVTADYAHPTSNGRGHAGIQEYLFPDVKDPRNNPPHRNIRSQVVVCNYDQMSHETVWIKYKPWMTKAPITRTTCPSWSGHSVVSWNP
jgi:hypothetical protein